MSACRWLGVRLESLGSFLVFASAMTSAVILHTRHASVSCTRPDHCTRKKLGVCTPVVVPCLRLAAPGTYSRLRLQMRCLQLSFLELPGSMASAAALSAALDALPVLLRKDLPCCAGCCCL